MYLPTFPRRMAAVRHVQTDFRGYDHRPSCPEGGIYEMTNGSAADSPLFSTRPGRTRIYPCSGTPNGLFAAGDGLLWCAGTTLYYNGKAVPGCTLTDTPKVFAALGGTVLIWPDKIWYRPDSGQFGSAEPSWSGSVNLQRSDDSSGTRADAIAAETTARVAGDALVKLKEITVTSEIAQIDMDFSDIDLRSFSKLIIRPALACTDNVDYRLRFGSGDGTIFRHYVNREFANYDYAAGLGPTGREYAEVELCPGDGCYYITTRKLTSTGETVTVCTTNASNFGETGPNSLSLYKTSSAQYFTAGSSVTLYGVKK